MATWLPGVLIALVGVIPGYLVYRSANDARKQAGVQAARTIRLEERKADREELQGLIDVWKQSFDAVTLDNKALRKELAEERVQVGRLRLRVAKLEQVLIRAGLAVPNGSSDPL